MIIVDMQAKDSKENGSGLLSQAHPPNVRRPRSNRAQKGRICARLAYQYSLFIQENPLVFVELEHLSVQKDYVGIRGGNLPKEHPVMMQGIEMQA